MSKYHFFIKFFVLFFLSALYSESHAKDKESLLSKRETFRSIKFLDFAEPGNNYLEAYEKLPFLEETQDLLDKSINKLENDIKEAKKAKDSSVRFGSYYYKTLGHVLGGSDKKYNENQYPKDSLFRNLETKDLNYYSRLTSVVYDSANFDNELSLKHNKEHFAFLKKSYQLPSTMKEDFEDILFEIFLYMKEISLDNFDESFEVQDILEETTRLAKIEKIISTILENMDQINIADHDSILLHTIIEKTTNLLKEAELDTCLKNNCFKSIFTIHKYLNTLFTIVEDKLRIQFNKIYYKYNIHSTKFKNNPIFKEKRFADYEVISTFFRNKREFSGFVLYSPSYHQMIVVFAGSKTFFDWRKNIRLSGTIGDANINIGKKGFIVNKGVVEIFSEMINSNKKIAKDLNENLMLHYKENKGKKLDILFLGHSLGGAVSTLAAYYFKTHLLKSGIFIDKESNEIFANSRFSNITFGSPRFISNLGSDTIQKEIGSGNILRFWNTYDIVPAVVTFMLNRKHVGLDIPLPDSLFYETWSPLQHHQMHRYWALASHYFPLIKKENKAHLEKEDELNLLEESLNLQKTEREQFIEQIKVYKDILSNLKERYPSLNIK